VPIVSITKQYNLVGVVCGVSLSGEDLFGYSNKIELVASRKCPHYHYLTKKSAVIYDNKHLSELAPHHGGKKIRWHIDMNKFRHCHRTCSSTTF